MNITKCNEPSCNTCLMDCQFRVIYIHERRADFEEWHGLFTEFQNIHSLIADLHA